MTYSQFIVLVDTHLGTDANRRGTEAVRDAHAKAAMADLKHHITCYQDNRPTYANSDQVPFDADAAEAVAYYIKARLARSTEKDLSMMQSFTADYYTTRRRLYRECNERKQLIPEDLVLSIVKGDTYEYSVFLTVDGAVFDPTGHEVILTVRKDNCEDAVFTLSNADTEGITVISAIAGNVLITMAAAQTELLEPGTKYFFDVKVITSAGKVHTVLTGRIQV